MCLNCGRDFPTSRIAHRYITPDMFGYIPASEIPPSESPIHYRTTEGGNGSGFGCGCLPGCLGSLAALVIVFLVCSVAVSVISEMDDGPDPPRVSTASVSTSISEPNMRHYSEKLYMLKLINKERAKAGAPPVILGNNYAAQLHAESSLRNCAGSHWGVDGLKPYMRYSLAGGYQSNGENWLGSDYCITRSDGYRSLGSIEEEIREGMEGWMDSPGHRRNILDKWHKKVNIGLAWDRYNFNAAQHFEGDYIEYDRLPYIESGVLYIAGRTKNGAGFDDDEDLSIALFYDPPPQRLTRGQLSRTYCYGSGLRIAQLRKPLDEGWYYTEDEHTTTTQPCPNPYDVHPDSPAPQSHDEAHLFWMQAHAASQFPIKQEVTFPAITATEWKAGNGTFSVTADLSDVLEEHGAGVYSLIVWASIDGERVIISEYSIFYSVTPTNTYNPE